MKMTGSYSDRVDAGVCLRIALAQLNSGSHDRDVNLRAAERAIDEAAAAGAELIVLPEFFNLPYFAQYWDRSLTSLAESADGPTMDMVRRCAAEREVFICSTIYERRRAGWYFDTAFLVNPFGEISGSYEKVHPAAVESLEKIYFRAGSRFPVWDIDGFKVAAIICYDHFFPESARCAALNGAELVIGPFAAPKSTTGLWREIMVTRAFENGVYMAPCNKVGREGEWLFKGSSMVVDPLGAVLSEAGEDDECIVLAEVFKKDVISARTKFPMVRDRMPSAYHPLVEEGLSSIT